MKENEYQRKLIKKLKDMFPGCMILKSDPRYKQGVPDLLIFYNDRWASLECKRGADSSKQPNQEYYVDLMNRMSFSRFIYPENEKEVLNELQRAFEFEGATRSSGSEQIPLA